MSQCGNADRNQICVHCHVAEVKLVLTIKQSACFTADIQYCPSAYIRTLLLIFVQGASQNIQENKETLRYFDIASPQRIIKVYLGIVVVYMTYFMKKASLS